MTIDIGPAVDLEPRILQAGAFSEPTCPETPHPQVLLGSPVGHGVVEGDLVAM